MCEPVTAVKISYGFETMIEFSDKLEIHLHKFDNSIYLSLYYKDKFIDVQMDLTSFMSRE